MNNFKEIYSDLLTFEDDMFYIIQVQRRKKDNPNQPKHVKTIRDFYIDSAESFFNAEPKIKELCDENNARAYIRLNRRSYKKVAFEMTKQLLDLIQTNTASNAQNLFAKVAGNFHSEDSESKTWVVDIDTKDQTYVDGVIIYIQSLYKQFGKKNWTQNKLIYQLETPNGFHLIASPFNLMEFKKQFPDIDIHKDNPTILYTPENADNT